MCSNCSNRTDPWWLADLYIMLVFQRWRFLAGKPQKEFQPCCEQNTKHLQAEQKAQIYSRDRGNILQKSDLMQELTKPTFRLYIYIK